MPKSKQSEKSSKRWQDNGHCLIRVHSRLYHPHKLLTLCRPEVAIENKRALFDQRISSSCCAISSYLRLLWGSGLEPQCSFSLRVGNMDIGSHLAVGGRICYEFLICIQVNSISQNNFHCIFQLR